MKIGINLLYLIPGVVGGTEVYARGLLHGFCAVASKHQFVIFLNRESVNEFRDLPPNFERVVCPVSGAVRWKRYAYEQFVLPRVARRHGLDVLHSLGYVTPLVSRVPTVVTIPDLNYRAFRTHWWRGLALRIFVPLSARRADAVITISEFSKRHIIEALRIPERKITVAHLAPKVVERSAYEDLDEPVDVTPPYLIAFSGKSENKNTPRLLEAFEIVRREHPEVTLAVVGHADVPRPAPPGVVFTGYVSDATAERLLSGAYALVFPSIYEGFGLPLLEAMEKGVPVVSSNRASLPEVGGDAAVYFDPLDVEAMASRISEIVGRSDMRDAMAQRGSENLNRFSWAACAQGTVRVYELVVGRRRRARK